MLKSQLNNLLKEVKSKYSLVIKNYKTGEIYSVNSSAKVSSASIIKLFILEMAFHLAAKKELDLEEKIIISNEEKVPFSIVSVLQSIQSYSIKDLLTLMTIQSDNTATNVLIDKLRIENISYFIKEQGYKNTVLERKMMDFESAKKGKENYTCAEDIALLFDKLYHGELVNKEYDNIMLQILKLQLDNAMMRMYLPDELEIAHKTGDISCVKHDTGIVYNDKIGDYIFVMLTYEAESDSYARGLIAKVSKAVYEYFLMKSDIDNFFNK